MIPGINAPFELVGARIGASADDLKLIFSFLISYPLAALIKRFPNDRPNLKNVYIISISLFFLVGLFDLWSGIRTLFITSAGAYLIAKHVHGPMMPWIAFIFLMVHMSINHIHRQIINDPSRVDVTGAQMVLVMKLSSFCWHVYDGSLAQENLTEHQRQYALRELPSILDYAGYVLFFPALFAGPTVDFVDYQRYINTSMFTLPKDLDPAKAPRTRNGKIPRSGRPALRKALIGLFWLATFVLLSPHFAPELLLGDTFAQYSFPRKLLAVYLVGIGTRFKYYAVWSLTEGACIMSGMGFSRIDSKGHVHWDRLQNVQPLKIETAQNVPTYLEGWNINTNRWLRHCIYLRVTPQGKKPGSRALLATFITSAVWHGFYPGYYLSFILASFMLPVSRAARRTLRPFFLEPFDPAVTPYKSNTPFPTPKPTGYKIYYDIFSWFVTQVTMSFVTVPFLILFLGPSLLVWSRMWFYCVIGTVAGMVIMRLPLTKKLQGKAALRAGDQYREIWKQNALLEDKGLTSAAAAAAAATTTATDTNTTGGVSGKVQPGSIALSPNPSVQSVGYSPSIYSTKSHYLDEGLPSSAGPMAVPDAQVLMEQNKKMGKMPQGMVTEVKDLRRDVTDAMRATTFGNPLRERR